jgi:hypothetical protein
LLARLIRDKGVFLVTSRANSALVALRARFLGDFEAMLVVFDVWG